MQDFEGSKTQTRDAMTPELVVNQAKSKSPSKTNKPYVDGEENIQEKSADYSSESYYDEEE